MLQSASFLTLRGRIVQPFLKYASRPSVAVVFLPVKKPAKAGFLPLKRSADGGEPSALARGVGLLTDGCGDSFVVFAVDGQALFRELVGAGFANAFDTLDKVVPALKVALFAGLDNVVCGAGANAFELRELLHIGSVDIKGSPREAG